MATSADDGVAPLERVNARLDSATLVFVAELRTVHYLLYRRAQGPAEPVLAGILASLASAMQALGDCLRTRAIGASGYAPLDEAHQTVAGLAGAIGATVAPPLCVPVLPVGVIRV